MSETIRLPHKPDSPLSYQFLPGQGSSSTTHLVVFLNGLIVPQDGWAPTIRDLQRRWSEKGSSSHPPLLTYDRYGQGQSARDPADAARGGTHSIQEVVGDLHTLVRQIWRIKVRATTTTRRKCPREPRTTPRLILVGNSIGCVIARLYAAEYPGAVEALLLLDSNIANSDLVSIFPDPDARGFDPAADLPPDVTIADLRRTREGYAAVFHPAAPNPEHLDRRAVAALLPDADAPALVGPGGDGPLVTVVGHDWNAFAEEGLRGFMRVPKSLTNSFMNPAWTRYNEGLVRITDALRARGPVTAVGCGHFIQRDDPVLVAELVEDLLGKVRDWKRWR
ncbi:alpha/beta-hydrolase [Annulohypoxylon truncatum]|uniref:alpha/beta-hydrolase n=1 Tax=Annulohypoxylon truncatum TaxID=327061 RepID=UPI002008C9CD|nr:alpha/beta-hydrolase [Annulohypoxylon truncatum]KAI1207941.1 alpha/beta-hydrolase [Annulohypoxylon truncatum]